MNEYSHRDERKLKRQEALLSAIRDEALATQQEIARALKKRGIPTTQVSVSRDIAELGLAKAGGRYVQGHPAAVAVAADPLSTLVRAAAPAGQHLVVVSCATGAAPRVGLALDQLAFPGIVGTLAGDDAVFVAVASAADNARLVRLLLSRLPASR